MIRSDLLALTPEAIASLANLGLVKRAQRELAEGAGPSLDCDADGTVSGTFGDGTVARLVAGKTFVDCPCTCGAAAVCRHRVAVALAYPSWQANHADSSSTFAESVATAEAPWSPAEITDDVLLQALGERRLARARRALRSRVLATVEFATPPTVRLSACTVRFLVPRDVAYARCDCAEVGACEHLALAVWAFRAGGPTDGVVLLGGKSASASGSSEDTSPGEILAPVLRPLLLDGLSHTPPNVAVIATARAALGERGACWLVDLLNELEQTLEGWHGRSALHGVAEIRAIIVEAESRVRAASGSGELPSAYVLGLGEASETLLDHVHLVSLGARVRADGDSQSAQVFLADADTATVLVLNKRWQGRAVDGDPLALRLLAPRMTLRQLAHGQVVSKAVKRRANRSIEIGTSRPGLTSVTPQRGQWEALPAPLLIADLESFQSESISRPPVFLRPRLLAENVHVVAVSEVVEVVYRAATQTLEALLLDAAGAPFMAQVKHQSVAPRAIDVAAHALRGTVRFVSGELSGRWGGATLDLLGIAGDTFVVPDVDSGPAPPDKATSSVVLDRAGPRILPTDPLEDAEICARGLLEELLQGGLRTPPAGVVTRVAAHGQRLSDLGLTSFGDLMTALAASLARRDADMSRQNWIEAALFGLILQTAD